MKKLVLASLAVAALAIASPVAAQAPYPPVPCTFTSTGSLATPGETIAVQGSCAPAGTTVTVTFTPPGIVVLSTIASPQGTFAGTFRVPKNAAPGFHTLTAQAGGKVLGTSRMNVLSPLSSPGDKKGIPPWAIAGGAAAGLAALAGLGFWIKGRRV
jgi:hypothetical protein